MEDEFQLFTTHFYVFVHLYINLFLSIACTCCLCINHVYDNLSRIQVWILYNHVNVWCSKDYCVRLSRFTSWQWSTVDIWHLLSSVDIMIASIIFLLTCTLYVCAIALNRPYLSEKTTIAGEHWTGWNFVIKGVHFQCSDSSKVAKMIYSSIWGECLFIFAPNLAVQSLEFDQKLSANFTKTSLIFHNGSMALTSI